MSDILSSSEIYLCHSLLNKIAFFNVVVPNVDKRVKLSRDYQDSILLDENPVAVIRAGRAVGKTTCIQCFVLQEAIANPNMEALLTTPNRAHLEPLFNRIVNFIKADNIYSSLVKSITRSPEYQLSFTNGFILYGRIAGTSKGKGLLGLHVDMAIIDESQLYYGMALDQLQGCLNPGCKIRSFGVPNGIRSSILVKTWEDKDVPEFCKHKITRLQDPNFTEKEKQRLINIYGSELSLSYKNMVMAEDDIAQNATFSQKYFDPCFVEIKGYDIQKINGNNIDENDFDEITLDLPIIDEKYKMIGVFVDVGYDPDPTVIEVLATDATGVSKLIFKYILNSITFPKQAKILNYLAETMHAHYLSIDAGGVGRAVILDLENKSLYPEPTYKLLPIDFQGTVVVGKTEAGDDIKKRIKFYSTVLLQRMFQTKKILLPENDDEIYNEIQSSTQTRGNDGQYTYNGVDHNLAALRCFAILPMVTDLGDEGDIGSDLYMTDF